MTILILTILNTIAIVCMILKNCNYYIDWRKHKTFKENTVTGYTVTLYRRTSSYCSSGVFSLNIPVRNRKKTEKREEIDRMIAQYSQQNKLQTLNAKFSWLRTWDEVRRFEKDYGVVDSAIVADLVRKFVPRHE